MRVRCLSLHSSYLCAHAGACCRAGWTIPVEERLIEPLRTIGIRIGAGRVAPVRGNGDCVFFEADAGRLCTIHRRGGPSLLPSACRHFPRVVVNDPRGTSVTLSHFCPTAAGLLFAPASLAIVDAPASIALDGLEGLDATSVLPPLLRAGVLTDWEGYSAWEEAAVELFNVETLAPEQAVDCLTRATDTACGWSLDNGCLGAAVRRAFADARAVQVSRATRDWSGFGRTVRAFLAAHAFASWAAYEPEGLRAVAASVEVALSLLRSELEERGALTRDSLIAAMGATDLRLRHRANVDARQG